MTEKKSNQNKLKPIIIGIILIGGIVTGLFNVFGKSDFWKSWELSAILSTLLYTLVLYFFGFIQEEFKGLRMKDIALLVLALGSLVFVTLITAFEKVSLNEWTFEIKRIHSLTCLTITSGLFWWLAIKISKNCTNRDIKFSYKLSKMYSDRPITIIFLIMTGYCLYVNYTVTDEEQIKHFEPFFSGAIAFQMMISNIVWTINDNSIIEETKVEIN